MSILNGKPESSVILANGILKTMSFNPFFKIFFPLPVLSFLLGVGGGGVNTMDNTHGKLTLLQEDSSVFMSNKTTSLMVFIFLVSTGILVVLPMG